MAASARVKPAVKNGTKRSSESRPPRQPRVSPEAARLARLKNMGVAIREARIERNWTQAKVGELLGDIPQTTISRWEKGKIDFTLEQIRELEVIFAMKPGSLLTRAGYCQVEFSSEDIIEALRMDTSVHPEFRERVVQVYRGFVDMTAKLDKIR